MPKDRFVYVTYIRTTPEKLWDALTEPEFTRAYWSGTWHDTTWKPGASWNLMIPDGRVGDSGEVLESIDRDDSYSSGGMNFARNCEPKAIHVAYLT